LSPLELLDTIEELFRLDPVASYAERGAAVVAQLAGADSHVLHDGDAARPSRERAAMVPLRHGRTVLAVLELHGPSGRALSGEQLRIARTASRLLVRAMLCAQRLAQPTRTKRSDSVSTAIARSPLTPREREVVALLVEGASTRTIASRTGLTVATVHTYLKRIYPKLGVHSRVELVARMVGTHCAD